MKDLKSVIKELKDVTKILQQDLEGGDPRTRPGREMLRNQSKEKLETLKKQYKESLNKSVFTIFTTGPKGEEFAKLAETYGALTVDGQEFYRNLAKRCEQTMGASRTYGLTQFLTLTSELRMWAQDVGLKFKDLELATDQQAGTTEAVLEIVKKSIEATNGSTLLKCYLENQVLNLALEQEADTKVVPVVVLNTTEQESLIGTLFRGKGLTLDTNKSEVNEELVSKTFEQIKKLLKG